MKLNLKVRFKNPVFIAQFVLSILTPILAYAGMTTADITSWAALGSLLLGAISNPYVLGLVAVSVWSALNDPTTKGLSDSDRALMYDEPSDGIGSADGKFTKRTSKPGKGNKFYITQSKGGYSLCIEGKPTDSECNVLSNCVGYACGRFNEILGEMRFKTLNCNAENFIERAKSLNLEISEVPTLGGIMVWQKGATLSGSDGAGHVEVVEEILSKNEVMTSASDYNGKAFYNATRNNSNGRWGLGTAYTFRGCIVNPAIGKVVYSEPEQDNFFPKKGYFKKGDLHANIGKISKFMRTVFPAYTDKKALGCYFGPYLEKSIKEFQRRTKLTPDGMIGPKTLAKLKENGFKP